MQRLYTMFPKGAPGAALLLLRVALGIGFLQERWQASNTLDPAWAVAAITVLVLSLCTGLLTPLMCVLCVLVELATWPVGAPTWQQPHVCIVLNAVALALLGPGAYSVDGRAFGRRKVVFPPGPKDTKHRRD